MLKILVVITQKYKWTAYKLFMKPVSS